MVHYVSRPLILERHYTTNRILLILETSMFLSFSSTLFLYYIPCSRAGTTGCFVSGGGCVVSTCMNLEDVVELA